LSKSQPVAKKEAGVAFVGDAFGLLADSQHLVHPTKQSVAAPRIVSTLSRQSTWCHLLDRLYLKNPRALLEHRA